MKTKLPETIKIVFTESDRQNAERFTNRCGCLIVTALRRMGFKGKIRELLDRTEIGNQLYTHTEFGADRAKTDDSATQKPLYLPAVVGKRITLKKAQ